MRIFANRSSTIWIFCLCLLSATASGQEAKRPEVSWVNPKLPAGPGLTHHILASKSLGHDVGYVVWKPAGFDSSGQTRYPVVYFLHGMGGNESADAGGFSSMLASGIRDGLVPPCLCIFPNGGRSGYRGGVERMIVDELIPLIDRELPTDGSAAKRIAAGFSMGGAGSVNLSIFHPGLFCGAGSWGGGMWRVEELLPASVDKNADALKKARYAALLINGDQDRPQAYQSLSKRFSDHEIPHQVIVLKDTPHNLGLYYQRGGTAMLEFLGKQLKQ